MFSTRMAAALKKIFLSSTSQVWIDFSGCLRLKLPLLDDAQHRQVYNLLAGETIHRTTADGIEADQVTPLENVTVIEEDTVVGIEMTALLRRRDGIDTILAEDVRSQDDDDLRALLL